ncbi:MAG: hypothetical protein HY876_09630, partial [Coriobacteriales bacterium]|nr:hypothetical protein [Coriobacteriales bacterium]
MEVTSLDAEHSMNDPNGRETDANLNEATSRRRQMASRRPVEGVLESSAAPSHPSAWLLVAAIVAAALVQVIAARALLLGWHGTVIGFGADLLLVLGIYFLASTIGRRAGAIVLAVVGVAVSALVLVAAIYLAYSDTLPTVGLLQISGQAGTVLDSVGDLFKS